MRTQLNTFHSGNWRCSFSNIPGEDDVKKNYLFDQFTKSVVLPDLNIEESFSDFNGSQLRSSVSRKNNDQSQLQLEFKASEELENYLIMCKWILGMKYPDQSNINTSKVRDYVIDRINITITDNQKRVVNVLYFTKARIINLSSLALNYGEDEELIFTTNFLYDEFGFED
jgi:hypothetical protein